MAVSQKALNLQGVLNKAFQLEIAGWLKKRSWGFKIGLFLASLHFVFFVLNTLYMIAYHDPRWHMFWIICGYADFPVSLLLTQVILPAFFHGSPLQDPYLLRDTSTMTVFLLFYAVVGTVWYFFLPILIEKAGKKIATGAWTLAAAVTMMIIPILAHWLQLLRFAAGDADCFAPRLYSILPAIWTVLLVWLYFATARRKSVLWLLLLMPFVFCYFLRDLYYYTTLIRH